MAPSREHLELGRRVYPWLHARATRAGVAAATEVYLGAGYIADVVGRCSFQHRFIRRYCRAWGKAPLVDWGTWRTKTYDQIIDDFICVFEVKVSRSDFLATFNQEKLRHRNRHKEVGHLHWIVAPHTIVRPEDDVGFWGLLEVSGQGLREVRMPLYYELESEEVCKVSETLLLTLRSRRGLQFK